MRYQDVAFRVAYVITRDAEEARDAAQSGFIKAYFGLPGFRPGAPFRPWLLRIVANEARNRRSWLARRPSLPLELAAAAGDDGGQTEAPVLAAERRERLLRAVRSLRDEDQLAVACRYLLDLTEAETVEVLGIPKGTVKSRLSRALAKLREKLDDDDRGRDAGV